MSDKRDDRPSCWSLLFKGAVGAIVGFIVGIALLAVLYLAFLTLVLPALG